MSLKRREFSGPLFAFHEKSAMAPYSEKSKQWREKNKESIADWRKTIEDLRNLANLENWSYERLDMEIAQRLDTDLRKIWDFSLMYSLKYKKSNLGKFFGSALTEIRDYGTIELSRKKRLLAASETTRRKMHGK